MSWVLVSFALVSGSSFLYYGYEILFGPDSRREFERYGIPGIRAFVGVTEFLGGAGVLLGLGVAPLGAAAAAGLTLMMAAGVIVRLRIHDAPRLMVPAASLGVVNAVLTALFLAS
jgi:uncharacterized membrane protein YphA (DoxX/SURF4 family)